jgi:hypothetical protein
VLSRFPDRFVILFRQFITNRPPAMPKIEGQLFGGSEGRIHDANDPLPPDATGCVSQL